MKLSRLERYKLSNQLRVLEALYPDEAEELAVQREGLESGYELLYDLNIDHIYDGESVMTEKECLEVWNTMDMFLAIDHSKEGIDEKELGDTHVDKFRGYDGNNETKFMGFAAYTVERLKRFTHLAMAEPGYFNSHMPLRGVYLRMLTEWEKIPMPYRFKMNAEQLRSVLAASTHPDNR